ncbi:MAG TPA: hypothetical protein VLA12_14790 [Planctomycetaceae bacterium]|nr:hypothetical protein [Planctomycetaceae bacterium]
MSSIPVELPDHLRSFVEEQAKQGGFADASGYITALVAAANEKQSEIELALVEGLTSGPAEPWSDEDWQGIRRGATERQSDT